MVGVSGHLHVRIVRGKGLLPRTTRGSTYIEVKVDGQSIGSTKAKKGEDPIFERKMDYMMCGEVDKISLALWEKVAFGRDIFLGIICVNMNQLRLKKKIKGLHTLRDADMQSVGKIEMKLLFEEIDMWKSSPYPTIPQHNSIAKTSQRSLFAA